MMFRRMLLVGSIAGFLSFTASDVQACRWQRNRGCGASGGSVHHTRNVQQMQNACCAPVRTSPCSPCGQGASGVTSSGYVSSGNYGSSAGYVSSAGSNYQAMPAVGSGCTSCGPGYQQGMSYQGNGYQGGTYQSGYQSYPSNNFGAGSSMGSRLGTRL